jgi:hypothetical protein
VLSLVMLLAVDASRPYEGEDVEARVPVAFSVVA